MAIKKRITLDTSGLKCPPFIAVLDLIDAGYHVVVDGSDNGAHPNRIVATGSSEAALSGMSWVQDVVILDIERVEDQVSGLDEDFN